MKHVLALICMLPLLAEAQLIPEVVQSCKRRNVFVEAGGNQTPWNEGSGIRIGANRILSAYHVVADKPIVRVDGEPARVIKQWKEKDLVLLSVGAADNSPGIEIADSIPTSEVFLVGNPKSCRNKVLYGSMIGVQKGPIYDPTYKGSVWLADMLGLPGASGGAVWDKDGRLVGVFKGWEKSGDVSVIIPGDEVRKFLENTQYAHLRN